jgi:hypothetical protein
MLAYLQSDFGDPPVLFCCQDDVDVESIPEHPRKFPEALLGVTPQVGTDFHLPTGKIDPHG